MRGCPISSSSPWSVCNLYDGFVLKETTVQIAYIPGSLLPIRQLPDVVARGVSSVLLVGPNLGLVFEQYTVHKAWQGLVFEQCAVHKAWQGLVFEQCVVHKALVGACAWLAVGGFTSTPTPDLEIEVRCAQWFWLRRIRKE